MKEKSIFTIKTIEDETSKATFETAISATGFGKFNYLVLILSVPCGWAAMMDTTSMSYVAPAAHCHLEMTLEQRGLLNGITYLGMISSALAWGFLADTLGRKKILVTGYLVDAIFVIIAGLSQTYGMLLLAKFFTGLIINGPFAALTTAVSEFHCAKYRARVIMVLGVIYSFAQFLIPGLAWLVIPQHIDYDLLNGNFKLHSWNFFILICAIPSLICSIGHSFLPESPKFLMTVGRNDEALEIKSLINETELNTGGKHGGTVTANRTKIQALKEGWQQIAPIFFPPHLWKIALAATIQSGFMLGANTIRLWLPQIFTIISDYQMLHPNTSASLCTMLGIATTNNNNVTTTQCIVNALADSIYINSMIVAGTAVIAYATASVFINRIGRKPSTISLSILSATVAILMYFAQNSTMVVALACMNIASIGICCNIELAIVVDMFPTTLRAVAISITLMIGRCGAMFGNLLFPYLLGLGCLPPFLMISCIIFICSLLSILLPKTDMKALE
ncbi:synaptic vesicle glycoprotein 2 [Holotrichia oblita]|uniref:Synaptic vesicle glycoprotein 2 n=1 Tax=Holotrichia oblita TaxID=644536 RepID=A0ACB9SQC0_HOLOL|nr:synaptic vesicle glycoprotein 2 [Holotrichia oblita]